MADKKYQHKDIPFSGKCIPAVDPLLIGDNDFQSLKNMRYTNGGVRSVQGMTKINANVINATNNVPTAGFHFNKPNNESHLLVQCAKSDNSTSKVYVNPTAIPTAGEFTATEIHTDAVGFAVGSFSRAPDDTMYYCNEEETIIFGGTESRCPMCIVSNFSGTANKDVSDIINDTLTSAEHSVKLIPFSGGNDAYTILLLHFDGVFTDSSTGAKTVTGVNDGVANGPSYVFGSKGYNSGSGATGGSSTTPDHADFNFSGGIFTIDTWVALNPLKTNSHYLFVQNSGAATDQIEFWIDANYALHFKIIATSVAVVDIFSADHAVPADMWTHVMIAENGDNWYLFVNGKMVKYLSDTSRAANYTGVVTMGLAVAAGVPDQLLMDEFRVSNGICRETEDFKVWPFPYDAYAGKGELWLGSLRPIKGVKFTVGTVNASAGISAPTECYYSNGLTWITVASLVDGTAIGTPLVPLKQTGTVSFTLVKSNEQLSFNHNQLLYWYRLVFNNVDALLTLTTASLDTGWQAAQDIWDGSLRSINAFYVSEKTSGGVESFVDYTLNVFEDSYTTSDATTYVELDGLKSLSDAQNQSLWIGFTEPMVGMIFNFIPEHTNNVSGQIRASKWFSTYWYSATSTKSGSAANRTLDGTLSGACPFGKNGVVMMPRVSAPYESKRSLEVNSESSDVQLYYYKVDFSMNLGTDVQLYFVAGIPLSRVLTGFKFPFYWQSKIWLCNQVDKEKNLMLGSSTNTSSTFNGDGSVPLYIGDSEPLTGATSLYSRVGTAIYEMAILCKKNETWMLAPENYTLFKVSDSVGCPAPKTMVLCNIGYEVSQGISRHVAVWQTSTSIVVFDTNAITIISDDIYNYFDRSKSECIHASYIQKSYSFFDEDLKEYHWLFWSGSTPTLLEWVYSFRNKKWFQIDRGTGKALLIGIPVHDTKGNPYIYGGLTSYLERLEYGNTFDGNAMVATVHFADKPLSGSLLLETRLRKIKLTFIAKNTTTNDITITHYADTSATGTTVVAMDPAATSRIKQIVRSVSLDAVLHSVKLTMTTSDETVGFEPLYLSYFYQLLREDLA